MFYCKMRMHLQRVLSRIYSSVRSSFVFFPLSLFSRSYRSRERETPRTNSMNVVYIFEVLGNSTNVIIKFRRNELQKNVVQQRSVFKYFVAVFHRTFPIVYRSLSIVAYGSIDTQGTFPGGNAEATISCYDKIKVKYPLN